MSTWVRGVGTSAGFFVTFPILFNFVTAQQVTPGYLDPTRNPASNYSKVSCDFSHDSCGWENVGGKDYPLTWVKKENYMHLDTDSAGRHKTGRLASPWLQPLQNGACFLTVRYFIRSSIRSSSYWDCQLSLLRQSFGQEDLLIWSTQKPTGLWAFSDPITNEINCTGEDFRIVFEGKGSCKVRWYDEIDIQAIVLTVQPLHGPTASARTPPSWTEDDGQVFTISHNHTALTDDLVIGSTTVGSFSSSTSHDHTLTSVAATEVVGGSTDKQARDDSDDQKSSGLDPGVAAGIIIAIIIVVIVFILLFIFVIVFMRRRRQKDKAMKRSIKSKTTCAVANAVYMGGPGETTGSNRAEEENHRHPNASDNHYELADMGPPSITSPQPPNNNNTHYDIPRNYDHIDHTTSASHTSTNPYDHVNNGAQPPDAVMATTNPYHNPDLTSEDNYSSANTHTFNRLSPCPDHSTDTYDHTNGVPLLKISRNGDNYDNIEQPSPAPNSNIYIDMEGSANQSGSSYYTQPDPAISTQKQEAENATASAARFAQMGTTEYETVGDVAEAMMTSSTGGDGGGGGGHDAYNSLDFEGERRREEVAVENVYDHAKDDSYDSLNHEGRRGQQRHLARNDYHHV